MNSKRIISGVLLLFVIVSVSYLVIGELNGNGRNGGSVDLDDSAADTTENKGERNEAVRDGHYVIAYYFHGNKRCQTCRTIEAYAEEAIATGFPELIDSGTLIWQTVNVDQPENQHYINDYRLASRTVVLVEVQNGTETRWKQLPKVWELVGNKHSFVDYVQESAEDFLGR